VLTVTQTSTGAVGSITVEVTPAAVVAPEPAPVPAPNALPVSGADPVPGVATAFLLVMLGLGVLLAGARAARQSV
jgi:hypothetical protein